MIDKTIVVKEIEKIYIKKIKREYFSASVRAQLLCYMVIQACSFTHNFELTPHDMQYIIDTCEDYIEKEEENN